MIKPSEPTRVLLDAWAAHHHPTPEVSERAWAAIQSRAAHGDPGPDLPMPSPGPAAVGISLKTVLGGLAGLCVAGAIGLALMDRDEAPGEASESIAASDPSTTSDPVMTIDPAKAKPAPLDRPVVAPAAAIPERTSPRRPATAEPVSADTLEAEMKLLGAARKALKRGDVDEALLQLASHAKQFPRGALTSEREQSRVTALCRAGRVDEARSVAKAYAKKHPTSPLAKRAASPCE